MQSSGWHRPWGAYCLSKGIKTWKMQLERWKVMRDRRDPNSYRTTGLQRSHGRGRFRDGRESFQEEAKHESPSTGCEWFERWGLGSAGYRRSAGRTVEIEGVIGKTLGTTGCSSARMEHAMGTPQVNQAQIHVKKALRQHAAVLALCSWLQPLHCKEA